MMQSVQHIIEQACIQNGSSYQGRATAMQALFKLKQNPPIPINPAYDLYAFATHSPRQDQCVWIITKHIKYIDEREKEAIIQYTNGKVLRIPMSKRRVQRVCAYLYKYHLYFKNPVECKTSKVFASENSLSSIKDTYN
ncbi:competence protein ComK [Amphibacillus cookii]|nr:competence protein ComK [Amphibacillus cookii]